MPVKWAGLGPELLLRLVRDGGEPLTAQLERELRDAIRSGRLGPGERLPSSRALALELGLISLRRLSAVRIATPLIEALAAKIDHAVSLAVWGTNGPTVVRLEEPSHPVHIAMRVGSVMALLETATGRVFAAFLPHNVARAALDAGLDRLGVGYNAKRSPGSPKVASVLAEVRRRKMTRAVGDPLPGVNAFAAPVFDHAGAVVLAITAMGPAGSFDANWSSPIAAALRDCADTVSRRLGYRAA